VKFFADECCDAELVSLLRAEGHDVSYGIELASGMPDGEVLQRAFSEKRILITEDKDFGELVFRFKKPAHGIVLLRFEVGERHLKWVRYRELILQYGSRLEGHFFVVDAEKIRIRPL